MVRTYKPKDGAQYYINKLKALGIEVTDDQVKKLQEEELKIKKPPASFPSSKKDSVPDDAPVYQCGMCQSAVTKSDVLCPNCGEPLAWSAIQ